MTRQLFSLFLVAILAFLLTAPALAGPHWLPSIHMPRINGGKALGALVYPVTKSLVNGGKDVLKVGAAADSVGLVPNIGPAPISRAVKKILWGVGRH